MSRVKDYIRAAIESFSVNLKRKEELLELIKGKVTGGDK